MTTITDISVQGLVSLQGALIASLQSHVQQAPLLVRVQGVLGVLPSSAHSVCHAVPLYSEQETVYLDLPKPFVVQHGLQEGDHLRVCGRVITNVYQGRLHFRLSVNDVEVLPSVDQARQERTQRDALARLKQLRRTSVPFPAQGVPIISVICTSNGRVFEDFKIEMASYASRIDRIDTYMVDAAAIARAIEQATGGVVVMIRGSGEPEEFRVFDHPQVVEALAAKKAYRVVGLGHADDTSLAGLVADFVGSTPSAAGAHVHAQLMKIAPTPWADPAVQAAALASIRKGWRVSWRTLAAGLAMGASLAWMFVHFQFKA